MRNRSLASHRLFRLPTLLPQNDESTLPSAGAPADDATQAAHRSHRNAIKMYPVRRYAWQHSDRFSVVALLARLWRPF